LRVLYKRKEEKYNLGRVGLLVRRFATAVRSSQRYLVGVRPIGNAAPQEGEGTMRAVEIVLRTQTPEGIEVVLPAIVYAKVLEEHASVATRRISGCSWSLSSEAFLPSS